MINLNKTDKNELEILDMKGKTSDNNNIVAEVENDFIDKIELDIKNYKDHKKDNTNKYIDMSLLSNIGKNKYDKYFYNDILVKFTTVNLSNMKYLLTTSLTSKIHLINTSYIKPKNSILDFDSKENKIKLNNMYNGNILILNVNCEMLDDYLLDVNNNFYSISSNSNGSKKYKNLTMANNIYNKYYNKKSELKYFLGRKFLTLNSLDLNKIFKENDGLITLDVDLVDLVKKSFVNNIMDMLYLLKNSYESDYEIIFVFKNVIWYKLVLFLSKNNIIISGGKTSKRNLLSPGQLLLSLVVSSVDKDFKNNIKKSFNNSSLNDVSYGVDPQGLAQLKLKNKDNISPELLNLFMSILYIQDIINFTLNSILIYEINYWEFMDSVFDSYIDESNDNSNLNRSNTSLLINLFSFGKVGNLELVWTIEGTRIWVKIDDREHDFIKIPDLLHIKSLVNSIAYYYKKLETAYDILDKYLPSRLKDGYPNPKEFNQLLKLNGRLKSEIFILTNKDLYSHPIHGVFKSNNHILDPDYLKSRTLDRNSIRSRKIINKRLYSTIANHKTVDNEKDINYLDKFADLNLSKDNSIISTIINNNTFIYLKNIILKDHKNLVDKQNEIEEFLDKKWELEYLKLLQDSGKLFNGSYGTDIILNSVNQLNIIVNDFLLNKKYNQSKSYKLVLDCLNSETLIAISLSKVVPFINKNYSIETQNVTELFSSVGKEILKYFYSTEYLKFKNLISNKDFLNNLISLNLDSLLKIYPEINIEMLKVYLELNSNIIDLDLNIFRSKIVENFNWDNYIEFKIGAELIEFIGANSEFYNVISENKGNRAYRYIMPDKLLDILSKKHLNVSNYNLPMLCEPSKWELDFDVSNNEYKITNYGGYLNNMKINNSVIHESNKNSGKTIFKNKDVVDVINIMQSTPFIINKKVLNYILQCINDNFNFGDKLILSKHINTSYLLKNKNDINEAVILEILKHNSYYNENITTLTQCLLLDSNPFYLPMFIDWRGRFYTYAKGLTYQSNEFTRCLIMFNEGVKLDNNGLKSLKIYLANCYGLKKLSLVNRLNWVDDNINKIIDIDSKFWFSAKEPFLFLSAALEYKDYLDDPDNFISKLPVYIDATCNGLQHMALMMNDLNLGKYVNILKSSDMDLPNDIYEVMVKYVKTGISCLIEKDTAYSKLSLLNIDRSFIKRGIMTIPYGVKPIGITEQLIADHFILHQKSKELKKRLYVVKGLEPVFFTYKDIMAISKIIHSALYETYPNLNILVDYLIEMNKFINNLNLNIPTVWTTPAGLIIEQKYVKMDSKSIKYSVLGKHKTINLNIKTDDVNIRRQNQGIVPNIVHSMDAANISLLIIKLLQIKCSIPIITIHDCFGTNANYVDLLSHHIRIAFLHIYGEKNFIERYHNFSIEYLKNLGLKFNDDNTIVYLDNKTYTLPQPPIFDKNIDLINNILGSKYLLN